MAESTRALVVEEPYSRRLPLGWWIVDQLWEPTRGPHGMVLIRKTSTPTFWRAWYRSRHYGRGVFYRAAWRLVILIAKRKHLDTHKFFGMKLSEVWRRVRW